MQTMNYAPETIELIEELTKELSYSEEDIHDFIREHGEAAFRAYYVDYCDLGERYDYYAVDAFIQEYGFEFESFHDAYMGEYNWSDFVEQYIEENVMYQIPEEFQMYFDSDKFSNDLSYDYIEVNGYIFNRNV